MLSDSEKRAAKLAVSRFGVDEGRLKQAFKAMLKARANGQKAELLDWLVGQQLLTLDQAGSLRESLDVTHFDVTPPRPADDTPHNNGAKDRTLGNSPAAAVQELRDAAERGKTDTGSDLRNLGKFRLLRRLGEGGMGEVYLAFQEDEGKQVALKILSDHLASSQTS